MSSNALSTNAADPTVALAAREQEAEILKEILGDAISLSPSEWRIEGRKHVFTLVVFFAPMCAYPFEPPLFLLRSDSLPLLRKKSLVNTVNAAAAAFVPEPSIYAMYEQILSDLETSSPKFDDGGGIDTGTVSKSKPHMQDLKSETTVSEIESEKDNVYVQDNYVSISAATEEAVGKGTVQELILTLNALERKRLLLQHEAAFARSMLLRGNKTILVGGSKLNHARAPENISAAAVPDRASSLAKKTAIPSSLTSHTLSSVDAGAVKDTAISSAPPSPRNTSISFSSVTTPTEETRWLKLVYGDACASIGIDPTEQLQEVSHGLRILLHATDHLWVSLVLKFPLQYPMECAQAHVADSIGLATGDMAMLEFMLSSKVIAYSLKAKKRKEEQKILRQ